MGSLNALEKKESVKSRTRVVIYKPGFLPYPSLRSPASATIFDDDLVFLNTTKCPQHHPFVPRPSNLP